MNIKEYLQEKQILADGAIGTYYGEKYQRAERNPEFQNVCNPKRIIEIHKEYLQAGAKLIRTNSFASNTKILCKGQKQLSRQEKLEVLTENIKAAYQNAKRAIEEENAQAWPAGVIGPIPEQNEQGQEELLEEYYAMADALLEVGAEIIWFETFSDYQYILPVAEYIKGKKDIFVMASFCLNKFGYTRSGISASGIIEKAKASQSIDGVGFNCGIGSTHMYGILKNLDFGNLVVSVMPNSGYPDIIKDRTGYQENIAYFGENMSKIMELGVNIAGGCCGTTPDYIQHLKENVTFDAPQRSQKKQTTDTADCIHKEANAFYKKLQSDRKTVIVELDPPHDGNSEKVVQASIMLKEAGVDMITFSDSPMGKMRADSIMTAAKIQREMEIPVMPHVTCRDKNRLGMGAAFLGAHMNGIRNMLLVTGDPVPQEDRAAITPVFDFNSMKLMEYLKQMNQEYFKEDPIVYGGALNYGRANLDKEIERMQKKCEAGADYFLTQPIYSDEDVEKIRYVKENVDTKVLCGIMPLVSYRNANFMKNEVFGVHVPEEIVARYHKDMSREEGEETGIQIALEIIENLSDVADGYYFMVPFNRASMICTIMKRMREKSIR